MPDHVHGIIVIIEEVRPALIDATPVDNNDHRGFSINVKSGSLGAIVRSYKAAATRRINGLQAAFGALIWQRGYWERIMRDDRELEATRQYITENPQRWAEGREDLDALLARMEGKA